MPIISSPQEFNEDDLYVDLRSIFGHSLFLKCEGFNFAGSIKLKAATEMVEAAERDGRLTPGSILVESSSGNLGVALSMIAANRGYRFLCVTDSRCNLSTRRMMEALGGQVHIITEPDPVGGFLGARINYVRALCASDDRYVWLNQYTNAEQLEGALPHDGAGDRPAVPATRRAVRRGRHHRDPDGLRTLVQASGTARCGSWRWTRVGSVTFGGPAGRRMIPGLGTNVRPPMLDQSFVDEVVLRRGGRHHPDLPPIGPSRIPVRRLHRHGRQRRDELVGRHDGDDLTAVAIAPDLGERYLDTVYQTNWVAGPLRRGRAQLRRAGNRSQLA